MVSSPQIRDSVPRWRAILAPNNLSYRIRVMTQLTSRRFQERLDPYGLTPFHWVVLCCLWEQDGLATSDISDRLLQVGGTMTGVIDRMEERGLVRRERDQRDRRVWRIWLTETGKQLYDVLPAIALEVREEAMQGISDEHRQIVSEFVDQVIANLTQ